MRIFTKRWRGRSPPTSKTSPRGVSPSLPTPTRSTRTSFGRSRANGTARLRTDPMRIHVLGTGALACFFGARLARVAEVTLIGSWTEGVGAIASGGIILETPHTEEAFAVKAVRLGAPLDAGGLVLVLVKAWQTDRVAREVPALTARDGHVLTLQNGLGNVEKLGTRALLGVTEQGATLVAPGRVRPCGDVSGPIAARAHASGRRWAHSHRRSGFRRGGFSLRGSRRARRRSRPGCFARVGEARRECGHQCLERDPESSERPASRAPRSAHAPRVRGERGRGGRAREGNRASSPGCRSPA